MLQVTASKCMTGHQVITTTRAEVDTCSKETNQPKIVDGNTSFVRGHGMTDESDAAPLSQAWKDHENLYNHLSGLGFDACLLNHYGPIVVTCENGINSQIRWERKSKNGKVGNIMMGTPLMYAAWSGRLPLYKFLVSMGCSTTAVNKEGYGLLHFACMGGSIDVVKYILSYHVRDKDTRGRKGRTPLFIATRYGHNELFKYLMEIGCDVEVVDDDKDTILHAACFSGSLEMVKWICEKYIIDIESRGNDGRTPVMVAVVFAHVDIFHFLFSRDCNGKVVDENGDNILHLATFHSHLVLVKTILTFGIIEINSGGRREMTALLYAAQRGNIEVFDFLLKRGASVLIVDEKKRNILHTACLGGSLDMVKHIVELDLVDREGRASKQMTALLISAAEGKIHIFDYLLSEGVDLHAVNAYKHNILHVATVAGDVDMVRHILSRKLVDKNSRGSYFMTALMLAAMHGQMNMLTFLIDQGFDPRAVATENENLLHAACRGGNVDMVKHVLSMKLFDLETKGGTFQLTPLGIAVKYCHIELFDFLVSRGSRVRLAYGNNVLHLACNFGVTEMVKHILSRKLLDKESAGDAGMTPLLIASARGHVDLVDFLLRQGCSVDAVNAAGKTVLHLACESGDLEMVKYLLALPQVQKIKDVRDTEGCTPEDIADENDVRLARMFRNQVVE